MRRPAGTDSGSVLLETAIAIPVLLAVTAALVWVASLGAAYVRALDAAQTAARQAARGAVIPLASDVSVSISEGLAHARVIRPVRAPFPLLDRLTVDVTAEATAHVEVGVVP